MNEMTRDTGPSREDGREAGTADLSPAPGTAQPADERPDDAPGSPESAISPAAGASVTAHRQDAAGPAGDGTPQAEAADSVADDAVDAGAGVEAEDSAADGAPQPQRPDWVPEKFWDAERGEVRTEALARSYRELESKLGRMVPLPRDASDTAALARLRRALGWPERPEDYDIRPPDPLIERDPELERRLHAAGFTGEQAQLVYELAAERLLPAVAEAVGELQAAQERAELEAHFGGAEAFAQVARQIRTWAERHLDPEEYATLAASARGVLALHAMMRSDEPEIAGAAGEGGVPLTEQALQEMMRDPRYWRDRDPEFVARVTRGFQELFGT